MAAQLTTVEHGTTPLGLAHSSQICSSLGRPLSPALQPSELADPPHLLAGALHQRSPLVRVMAGSSSRPPPLLLSVARASNSSRAAQQPQQQRHQQISQCSQLRASFPWLPVAESPTLRRSESADPTAAPFVPSSSVGTPTILVGAIIILHKIRPCLPLSGHSI